MEQKPIRRGRVLLYWLLFMALLLLFSRSPLLADEGGKQSPPRLRSLSIIGPDSLGENTSATYRAVAKFSNGTTQSVTSSARWSERSPYATLSGGVLTAGFVTGDQSVIIAARYSSSGVTRSASMFVTILDASGTPSAHGSVSTNSTSQNRDTLPDGSVVEQPSLNQSAASKSLSKRSEHALHRSRPSDCEHPRSLTCFMF